jgi:hypothetical protein
MPEMKKGPAELALSFIFLLPVGLADFMVADATVERFGRQLKKVGAGAALRPRKKPRLFKGRGQLTGRKCQSRASLVPIIDTARLEQKS